MNGASMSFAEWLRARVFRATQRPSEVTGSDARDRAGRTPLMNAVIDGDLARTRDLLARGANPDDVDRAGWCALHFAAQEHAVEAVRMLVGAGAALELRDRHGNTPLWRAVMASKGRGEVIALLLEAGADPDAANASGHSPRGMARTIANYEIEGFFAGY